MNLATKKYQRMIQLSLIIFLLQLSICGFCQPPSFTANDKVVAFGAPFGYGVNPGYYGDATTGSGFDRQGVSYDIALAELARKVGLNTWRPTLPAHFFLQFGNSPDLAQNNFDLRINEFTDYKNRGVLNNVVFIGDATDHQDGAQATTLIGNQYRNLVKYPGCDKYSYEFKNMYEPIWDNGANGTPVNDNNYYALYIYKLVSKYKGTVKVYEVVNEIDFLGASTVNPDDKAGAGTPAGNNWYDRNPTPCELLNWRAPIFSYIRMLRITYEVLKTVDPTAFVAIGGIGYESFMDVVLRNTDNPTNGSIDATNYPKLGGAYFDVVSYHNYPQYDLKKKDQNGNNVFPFVHLRYSDAASELVVADKDKFQGILTKYKYDGTVYPLKHFIITETNIPRRTYDGQDWIGSDDAQKNFVVKVMIKAQKKGIRQVHIFALGEGNDIDDVSNKEGHEGLYLNLKKASRTNAVKTSAGRALTTATALLDSLTYDDARTTSLALPANVDGAAFKTSGGKYVYVLWAKTTVDNSEDAAANYTFPASLNISNVISASWDFTATGNTNSIPSTNIPLNGFPAYFTDKLNPVDFNKSAGVAFVVTGIEDGKKKEFDFSSYPNPSRKEINFSFTLPQDDVVTIQAMAIDGSQSFDFVKETFFSKGKHDLTFNNNSLAQGVYIVQLQSKKTGIQDRTKIMLAH
jgi:hypothetical protein